MLAILATHPIQYQIPIWQRLARNGRVPFEVWYLTAHGVKPSHDPEFGKAVQWDVPLLEGYPHRFVAESVPDQLGRFWQVGLTADFRHRLTGGHVKAVFVQGWNVRACWEAAFAASHAGVRVWMRGDSNDLKVDRGLRRIAKRWLLGRLFDRVDHFLYVGQANRRLYQGYGVNNTRLVPGPHCVDNARFTAQAQALRPHRQALRQSWRIPDDAFCLLYVGKFIPKKRPLDLVAAARRLLESDPGRSFYLLFVGTGELGDAIRQQVQVVFDADQGGVVSNMPDGQAPHASFAGFLNQTEISKAYIAADALVLPSDPEETWGLVVNEAMASGLPCVVSAACGSAEDLVVPLDPKLSYPCGDVTALAASIRRLADHPIPPAAISEHIARYDLTATVETLERLWTEVAKS